MLIKTDPDIIRSYFEDSSNLRGGHAEKVVYPENIEELASFLREANSKGTPVTVSGGGTGTTGSRIPFGGEILSMEKFNKIMDISKEKMSSIVQAGLLVEDFKRACEKEGLFYSSHPTENTASIGGTVATNASGARSFKHGPTRRYVKRLKMVLANGSIFDVRRGERLLTKDDSKLKLSEDGEIDIPLPTYKMPDVKNSAGYYAKDGMDLIDLFIGQEGTLSIVAEIEFELVKKPAKILSSFVFFKKEEDSWNFSNDARENADVLSIEYFDSNALELLRAKDVNVPHKKKAAIFFEEDLTAKEEDASLEVWLDLVSKHNAPMDDTWVAMNESDAAEFTRFRHAIPDAVNAIIKRNGFQKLSTDIAVPRNKFLEMLNFYMDALKKEKFEHVIFGHIGESHLHVNILPKSANQLERGKDICLAFAKKGVELGGTVSAEHGIGKIKHKYLEIMYGESGILEMARIKKAFDPNCILGLDNIFPKDVLKLA